MIGNSSSGIVEAPTFNLPFVNIGTRQEGRLMAENVLNCVFNRQDIVKTVARALTYHKMCHNPYGDGKSAKRIVNSLIEFFTKYDLDKIRRKKFYKLN